MIIGQIITQASYDCGSTIAATGQTEIPLDGSNGIQVKPFAGVMQTLSQDKTPLFPVATDTPLAATTIHAMQIRPELLRPLPDIVVPSPQTFDLKTAVTKEIPVQLMKKTERIPLDAEPVATADLQIPQNVELNSSFILASQGTAAASIIQALQAPQEVEPETKPVELKASVMPAPMPHAQATPVMQEQQLVTQPQGANEPPVQKPVNQPVKLTAVRSAETYPVAHKSVQATAQPVTEKPVVQPELQTAELQTATQPVIKPETTPRLTVPAVATVAAAKPAMTPSVFMTETKAEPVERPAGQALQAPQEVEPETKPVELKASVMPAPMPHAQATPVMQEQQLVTQPQAAEGLPVVLTVQQPTPIDLAVGTRHTLEETYFQTVSRPLNIEPVTMDKPIPTADLHPAPQPENVVELSRLQQSPTEVEHPAEAVIASQKTAQNVQTLHAAMTSAATDKKVLENRYSRSGDPVQINPSEQLPEQGLGTNAVKKVAATTSDNNFSDDEVFAGKDQQPVLTQPVVHSQTKTSALFANAITPETRDGQTNTSEHLFQQVKENLTNREYKQGIDQISLRLTPENMGELKMTFRMEGQQLKIDVVTDNNSTRDTLLKHSDALKETLAKQNISMESFSVSTGSSGNSSGRDQSDWRELVKQRQYTNAWMHTNSFRRADTPSQQTLAYQAKSAYSLVDVHF